MISKKPISPFHLRLLSALLCAAVIVLFTSVLRSAAPAQSAALTLFATDIRPLLTDHCVKCHGGEKTKGEFDLTTRQGLLHPGDEGPNVIPGNSKASRLMKLIRHEDDPFMPSKAEPLSADGIAKIAAWIDAGAPYDKPLIEKTAVAKGHPTVTPEDPSCRWTPTSPRPV
jgi:cytochrome c553